MLLMKYWEFRCKNLILFFILLCPDSRFKTKLKEYSWCHDTMQQMWPFNTMHQQYSIGLATIRVVYNFPTCYAMIF